MRKGKTLSILALPIILLLSGCINIKPTYTKENIVDSITALCEQEYGIKPRVWLKGETVWIYMPLPRLLNKDFDWDKENSEKINKVMLGVHRVLLSMKPRPQFMVLVASDTEELGIDYYSIAWIPDIVKFQLRLISRDEFSRRHVVRIVEDPKALSDTTGKHLVIEEIRMGDFLAAQIAQRINQKFTLDEKIKDCYEVKEVYGTFQEDTFEIKADIKQIKPLPKGTPDIDIEQEMSRISAYVIKEYDFNDFLMLKLEDPATGVSTSYSRLALRQFLK